MKLTLFVLAMLLFAAILVAGLPRLCFAGPQDPIRQSYSTPEAKVGDIVVCPVMGGTFTVSSSSLAVTIDGKKYYVCCSTCVEKLKSEPDKYLKDTKSAADKTPVTQ